MYAQQTIPVVEMKKNSVNSPGLLSKREIEILALTAEGFTGAQIAVQLFRSLDTVETHKKNIIKKLEARNTTEAVAKAIRMKLI